MSEKTKWRVYYESPVSGKLYLKVLKTGTKWLYDAEDGDIWPVDDAQTIARAVHLLTGNQTGCERVLDEVKQ